MFPFPFVLGKWLLDRDLADANVVGGDVVRSKNELKVEELLLPLLVACDCGSSMPSLLEVLPEEWWVSDVWIDALERLRRLKSFKNEGIAGGRGWNGSGCYGYAITLHCGLCTVFDRANDSHGQ